MKNRENRLDCDVVYVQLVGRWVAEHGSNIKEGAKMVNDIMKYYRAVLDKIQNKKINTKDIARAK